MTRLRCGRAPESGAMHSKFISTSCMFRWEMRVTEVSYSWRRATVNRTQTEQVSQGTEPVSSRVEQRSFISLSSSCSYLLDDGETRATRRTAPRKFLGDFVKSWV